VNFPKEGLEVGYRSLDLLAQLIGHRRVIPLGRLERPLECGVGLLRGQEGLLKGGVDFVLERGRLRTSRLQILSAHQRNRRAVFVPSKASSGKICSPLGVMAVAIRGALLLGLVKVPLPLVEGSRAVPCPFVFEQCEARTLLPESVGHVRQKFRETVGGRRRSGRRRSSRGSRRTGE
jgi:hypothetical protein